MVTAKDLLYMDSAGSNASTIPSGDIDLKALVRGENFWESPFKQIDKDKKTLIFYSWFCDRHVSKLIHDLKGEGFEIYFSTPNGSYSQHLFATGIDAYNLKLPEEIAVDFIEKNPELKLARDEVQVLDYKLLKNLIDNPDKEYPETCDLFLSDMESIRAIQQPNILDYEAILNSSLKAHGAGDLAQLAGRKDITALIGNLSQLTLNSGAIVNINAPGLTSLLVFGNNSEKVRDFSNANFPDLEKLHICQEKITDVSQNLFNKNIREIKLRECTITDDLTIERETLSSLESIVIYNSSITSKNFVNMLSSCEKNLQELELENIILTGDAEDREYDFPNLASIIIADEKAGIDANFVYPILKATGESLKTLHLGGINNLNDISFKDLPISGVKQLMLEYNSNTSLDKIKEILQSCSASIESIGFGGDIDKLKDLDLENLVFPNLRDINIQNDGALLDNPLLVKLMEKAGQSIEALRIGGIHLPSQEDLEQFDLSNLYIFDIEGKGHDQNSFNMILESAKDSLDSLVFNNFSFSEDSESIDLTLSNLTKLNAESSEIPSEYFNSLIYSSQNSLRELQVNDSLDIELDLLDLPNLISIDLGNHSVSGEVLFNLIKSSHKSLSGLNIGSNVIPDQFLEELEELDFPNLVNFYYFGRHPNKDEEALEILKKASISYPYYSLGTEETPQETQENETQDTNFPMVSFGNLGYGGIEASTTSDTPLFKVKPIFYSLDNSLYRGIASNHVRQESSNTLLLDDTPKTSQNAIWSYQYVYGWTPQTFEGERGKLEDFAPQDGKTYVKALIDAFPVSNEFAPLPSLSRKEDLKLLEAEDDIEIIYDEYTGLYKVKSISGEEKRVQIKYILELPENIEQEFDNDKNRHPQEVQDLIEKVNSFTNNELKLQDPNEEKSSSEWLDEIYKQEVGACTQRAAVFKYKLEKDYPNKYQVNIVKNGVHAFCEYRISPHFQNEEDLSREWKSVDLGGGDAHFQVEENSVSADQQSLKPDDKKKKDEQKKLNKTKKTLVEDPIALEEIYCNLKESDEKKCLIKLAGKKQVDNAANTISVLASLTEDEIFNVRSANDLICSRETIFTDPSSQGDLNIKGYVNDFGGALYDYIMKARQDSSDKKYFITIDLSKLEPSQIVSNNTIFDENPSIDVIEIPDNVIIFALSNTLSINYYDGFDFIRRFPKEKIYDKVQVGNVEFDFVEEEESTGSPEEINLYEQSNWKDILFGKWIIKNGDIIHTEGEITPQLKSGVKELHIKNAKWDEEFVSFWKEAVSKGYLTHDGTKYPLPEDFKIKKSYGYDLREHEQYVNFKPGFAASLQTINPSYAYMFFDGYRPNLKARSMEIEDGLIKAYSNSTLRVNLSRRLDESIWNKILDHCKKYNTKLEVHCSSSSHLPNFANSTSWDFSACAESQVRDMIIDSKNLSLDTIRIKKQNEDALVLDISEVAAKNIIGTIEGKYLGKDKGFVFEEKSGFLEAILKSGQNVILKGKNISAETKDVLSRIIVERGALPADDSSKLFIITDNVEGFSGAAIEKSPICEDNDTKDSGIIKIVSDTDKKLSAEQKELDFTQTEAQTQLLQEHRTSQLDEVLDNQPYVWLYGNAGVGKTKFVTDYAAIKCANLYLGYESLNNWAKDESGTPKYLFIDEANLKKTDYTIFESMFNCYNSKPVILLENELIELSPNHKVILAGNPTDHGNGRNIPELLKEHGGEVYFSSLPIYFIYEKILKGIFGEENKKLGQDITCKLDKIYDLFNTNLKKGATPLTPREIANLALISYSKTKAGEDPDLDEIAYKYYSNKLSSYGLEILCKEFEDISADIVSKTANESLIAQYSFLTKKVEEIEYEDSNGDAKAYSLVPSREEVFSVLEEMMNLRKFRIEEHEVNQELKWPTKAGQFGLILEGLPKTGKSEIIKAALSHFGLKKGEDWLYLPVSMQNEAKRILLKDAMMSGKMVMIDELNSVAIDEDFMNQILDGHEKHPGFTILATQNSASSLKGRFNIPEALSSRMIKLEMPNYTEAETRYVFGFEGSKLTIEEVCLAITQKLFEGDKLQELIDVAKKQGIIDGNLAGRDFSTEEEAQYIITKNLHKVEDILSLTENMHQDSSHADVIGQMMLEN